MKMSLTWRMGPLLAVGCVILMKGTAVFAAERGTNNNYKVTINGDTTDCPPCSPTGETNLCSHADQRKKDCRCTQGHGCHSSGCNTCVKLPPCGRSQLKRTEQDTTVYLYYCQNCTKGTFYEEENGKCKPGKEEISTTTIHQEEMYSVVPSTRKIENSSFDSWISLALCLALAVFIVLLITVIIHLLIWKIKASHLLKKPDPFQLHLMNNRHAKEDTDTWSCQYPEEEHGEEHGNGPVEKHYV
ncbi:tumor necrosis factor receptor superfamily member 18 [Dendropsophus ebraccatus]|uniref:tumor necrosis factor receptor superfamily member 18 n=1 Tax=Dendropsophus ebraccatus TaxID=150705 RepID=UPI003831F46F